MSYYPDFAIYQCSYYNLTVGPTSIRWCHGIHPHFPRNATSDVLYTCMLDNLVFVFFGGGGSIEFQTPFGRFIVLSLIFFVSW